MTIAEMLVVAVGAVVIVTGAAMFDLVAHGGGRDAIGVGVRAASRSAIAGLGACAALGAATAVSISRRTLDALNDRSTARAAR